MSLLVGELYASLLLHKQHFTAGLASAQKEAQVAGQGIGASLATAGKIAAVGLAATAAAMTLVAVKATDMAADFQASMANVQTLMGPGSESEKRIAALGQNVKDMAIETGKSLEDLSGGLYEIIGTFGDVENASELLEVAARAGAAGLATTKESISLIAAVTKSYGDISTEAAQKVSDLAFQTMNLGVTTFPEMAAAMGRVIPTAAALKVSQEELFAVMATLTGVTGSTDEVVTQLRGSMTAFMKPSREMRTALEELGYAGVNAGQDIVAEHGLVGAIQMVESSSAATELGIAKLFRNTNTLNAVFALTGDSADDFAMKLKAMGDASGATQAAFEIQHATVKAMGERIGAAFEVMMVNIGERILPALESLLTWVLENMPAIAAAIEGAFAAIGDAVKPIIDAFGAIVTAGAAVIGFLNDIGFIAPVAAVAVTALAVAIGTALVGAIVGVVTAAAPVIAVVAAIGGAVFLLEKALNNVGLSITDVLGGAFEVLINVAKGVIGTLLNVAETAVGIIAMIPGPMQAGAQELQRHLGNMRRSVDRWGVETTGSIRDTMGEVGDILSAATGWDVDAIVTGMEDVGGKIVDGIAEGIESGKFKLQDGVLVAVEEVEKTVDRAKPGVVAAGAGLGEDLGEAVFDEFGEEIELGEGEVAEKAKSLVEVFGTSLQGVVAAAENAGGEAMSEMAKAITESRTRPLDAFDALVELMKTSLTPMEEIARLIGIATSKELAIGVDDARPDVRAQAEATRKMVLERWMLLKPTAKEIGKDGMNMLKEGMKSKNHEIRAMSKILYDSAVSSISRVDDQTYNWGRNAMNNYIAGLQSKEAYLQQVASRLAGALGLYLKVSSPAERGALSKGGGPEGWGARIGLLLTKGLASTMPGLMQMLDLPAPGFVGATPTLAFAGAHASGRRSADTSEGRGGGEVHYHVEVGGLVEAKNPFEIARALRRVSTVTQESRR